MAHSLSAKKRVRQDVKKRVTNRAKKSVIKTQIKGFQAVLDQQDVEKAEQLCKALTKKLDKVASTSTMHKNTASRIKSRMAKRLNTLKTKKTQV